MNDVIWWVKGKWITCKLTFNQIVNVYIKGNGATAKGIMLYDYCIKVAFDNYEPQTYQEMMLENTIQEEMKNSNCDRKTAAMLCGGYIAQHMKPSDFWSSDRPGKFICA